jgi:hypothetical protein
MSSRSVLPKKELQEDGTKQNTERNDKRNDGDGKGHYRRDAGKAINMV